MQSILHAPRETLQIIKFCNLFIRQCNNHNEIFCIALDISLSTQKMLTIP